MYEYQIAEVRRVVDGDTFDCRVDLGFEVLHDIRVRVLEVDTPEMRGGTDETKAAAQRAKEAAERWLSQPGFLTIRTVRKDSFGRWLGDVRRDGESLASWLIDGGYGEGP